MDENIKDEIVQRKTFRMRTVVLWSLCASALTAVLLSAVIIVAVVVSDRAEQDTTDLQRQTVVQEGDLIADVAKELDKSVVSIVTRQVTSDMFLGTQQGQGAGTGVVIDNKGLILTNKHVVPSGTNRVQVVAADGTTYSEVEIVGRDPLNDLAILRVKNADKLSPARLGDSDKVRTGQKVIAIGNALGQFQNTVTSGIISGLGRPVAAQSESGTEVEQLTNLFQTDAAINSGNSGGPLLNYNGEVIGINTAIAADAQNIGFAIPINEAKGIIASVQSTGKLSRPYIGVRYISLTPALAKQLNLSINQGAYIPEETGSIVRGGPADQAGLRAGDVITKVEDQTLSVRSSLVSLIGSHAVGDTISLTIVRGGKEQTLDIKLGEAPQS